MVEINLKNLSMRLGQGLYEVERRDNFEREHFIGVIGYDGETYFFNAYRVNGIFFTGNRRNDKLRKVDRPVEELSNDALLNLGLLTFKEVKRKKCKYIGRAGKVTDAFCRHFGIMRY